MADLRPDLELEEWVCAAVAVPGMGWTSASGLLQYLLRRLLTSTPRGGAELPMAAELRKDRPSPPPPIADPQGHVHRAKEPRCSPTLRTAAATPPDLALHSSLSSSPASHAVAHGGGRALGACAEF